MNPVIYQGIAPIVMAPQMLLAPVTNEVGVEAVSSGAWVKRTPWQVIRAGVDGSTLGDIRHAVSVIEPPSPVLIGISATYPHCGLNTSQQVANKRQSTSPALVGHTQKLDAFVDGKLSGDLDSASIFNKVIAHKISDGSSVDLYTHSRMKFRG